MFLHIIVKRPFSTLLSIILAFIVNDIEITLNIMTCISICCVIVSILKDVCKVERPCWVYQELNRNIGERSYSFPSGHTITIAGVFAVALFYNKTPAWIYFFIMVVLMPISRLYLCVHWITDVLVSLFIAIIIPLIWKQVSILKYFIDTPEHVLLYCLVLLGNYLIFAITIKYKEFNAVQLPIQSSNRILKKQIYSVTLNEVNRICLIVG